MKKNIFVIILLFSVLYSFSQSTVDKIIAVVGTEIILQSDLEKLYSEYKSQFQIREENDGEEMCVVFENMIFNKLMMHQAELDSVIFTEEQVDEQVNYRIQMIVQQNGGDPKILEDYYKKSLAEIKLDLREMMYEQMVVQQIQTSITENVTVTPTEVKKYLNKFSLDSMPMIQASYEIGHIVRTPPVGEEEIVAIKERLEGYRERVLRGEKFSMLARLYSDDPGSASKGGNLGFVERGTLYPQFEAVAFTLKTGEISHVIQTQAGYHIIQMIERRGESINVAHILIQPKPSADEQVRSIEYLDSVKKVIIAQKMDFSEAAKLYSSDLSKNSGGWVVNPYTNSFKFDQSSMDQATYATIAKLIPEEYSDPIPYITEDGVMSYRILYLKSKVPEHKANLVEDYDMIKDAALEAKKEEVVQKWIKNKVKVTSIKIDKQYWNCPFILKWEIPQLIEK